MAEVYQAPKDLGEEIKLLFDTFDNDHSGSISHAELKRLLQHIDGEQWTDETVEKLLAGTDSNGDGELQFTEFWSWIAGHGAGSQFSLKGQLLEHAIVEDKVQWERAKVAEAKRDQARAEQAGREEVQRQKDAEREAGNRIGMKEFVDARVEVGINRHVASTMFAKGDEDHDGEIGRDELGWLIADQATTVGQIKGLFKQSCDSAGEEDAVMVQIVNTFSAWDKDGDGTISTDELIRVIQTLNPKLTQKTAESMIKQADTNGDGEIDIREFVGWMSGVNPKKKKAKEIREAKMAMAAHMKRSAEARDLGVQGDFEEFLHRSYPSVAASKKIHTVCGTLNKGPGAHRLCVSCKNRHGWLCHGCGFVSYEEECVNECGFGTYGWTCLQGDCKKKCGCKKKREIWQRRGFVQDLDTLSHDVKRLLASPAEAPP